MTQRSLSKVWSRREFLSVPPLIQGKKKQSVSLNNIRPFFVQSPFVHQEPAEPSVEAWRRLPVAELCHPETFSERDTARRISRKTDYRLN